MSEDWDPEALHGRIPLRAHEAHRQEGRQRRQGTSGRRPQGPQRATNVIDLASVLRQSLAEAGKAEEGAAGRKRKAGQGGLEAASRGEPMRHG